MSLGERREIASSQREDTFRAMGNLTLLRLFGINHHLPFNATRLPSNSWHIVSAPSALSLREVATLGAIKLLCY